MKILDFFDGAETESSPIVGDISPIDATAIADGSVSNAEFQRLDGVTSPIQTQLNAGSAALAAHIADTTDAHAASAITNTPAGVIVSTNVQDAVNEVQGNIEDVVNTIGAANGIAPLDATGKVASSFLPSYVDDVLEFANLGSFPGTGETGKIYVALDTNKCYRWTGSVYVEVSTSDVNSVNGSTGNVTVNAINELTGDVTAGPASQSQSKVATIAANVVSNAKLAQVATATFKGRTTAGTGNSEDLTVSQAKTLLNLTGTNSGDQTITLTGDITGSGTSSFAATIAANAVSNSKMAQMAQTTIKGRAAAAGTGDPTDLSASQVKTILDLTGTNSGDQTITLTGDVTGSGTGSFSATIANDAVTNAKLANMATATFKGRTTAGTGDPEDLSVAQAQALLSISGTNTGDQTITLTGDLSGSGTGSFSATIANNAVTNAKLNDMATQTFKGRTTAGTGDPEDLSVAQAKTMLSLTGTNSGDQTITLTGDVTGSGTGSFAATIANDSVTYAKMQNVSAISKLIGRGSAGGVGDPEEITLGTNLSMSGTTLNASSGGTPSFAYATKSANYTVTVADYTLVGTANTFAFTLPSSTGINNIFEFVHEGTSLTDVMTIQTTGGELITGNGVSATSVTMVTKGERWRFQSTNGSGYKVIGHDTKSKMSATTANTFVGTTTNPTKATSPDVDLMSWYREGAYAVIHYRYQHTTNTGATSGTGSYEIALPSGLTADTTEVPVQTSLTVGLGAVGRLEGVMTVSDGSNYTICGNVNLYDSTHVRVWSRSSGGVDQYWASTSPWPLGGAAVYFYGWVRVKISGWLE